MIYCDRIAEETHRQCVYQISLISPHCHIELQQMPNEINGSDDEVNFGNNQKDTES